VVTALLNGQLFVARNSINSISVYDTTSFNPLPTISSTVFGTTLYGLATSAINNYLFISDYGLNCIHRVDLSVTTTVSVFTWSVNGRPWGLSTTSVGNILAAIINTTGSIIGEYAPDGRLVRSITTTSTIWQAVEVNEDVLAVTVSSNPGQLCTMFRNGTVIKCLGTTTGSAIAQMNVPRSIVIGALGYYIVADHDNNRILMVDPSLTIARQLSLPLDSPLSVPNALSFNQSLGRLYVGEDGGQHRVLIFDGIW